MRVEWLAAAPAVEALACFDVIKVSSAAGCKGKLYRRGEFVRAELILWVVDTVMDGYCI